MLYQLIERVLFLIIYIRIMTLTTYLKPEKDQFLSLNEASSELCQVIIDNILNAGYCVIPNAVPTGLLHELQHQAIQDSKDRYSRASIGRSDEQMINNFVRTDEIVWINGEKPATKAWINWCNSLRLALNENLYLGLFSFESHFAHYAPGAFYKRHLDAFRGEANRVLSIVVYLNSDWLPEFGGELVLYRDENDVEGLKVTPLAGTLVAFLSEEFPHEVLAATRDRYSIAGWFRLNASSEIRVDPPR